MNTQEHSFKHNIPIQIRFSDIDPVNHVNNSIVFQYYDLGRINYFENIMGTKTKWSDISVVIVNLDVNFLSPIFLYDNIVVQTKVLSFGTKSMKMYQQIIDTNTQTIKSTCTTILSGFDKTSNTSLVIPQEFKTMFEEFERSK